MTVTNHASAKVLNHNPVSPVRSREGSQRASASNGISTVFILNVIISLVAGLLIIYYVVQANIIAADNYKINLLNEKLDSLNGVRSSLAAQKSSMEDPARIRDFAVSQNMVEAKNTVYLFENGNVALQR